MPAPRGGGSGRPCWSGVNQVVLVGTALVVVVGAAVPALAGRIPPSGSTVEVPPLLGPDRGLAGGARRAGHSLLAPGSTFADYQWGTPRDEPMQSLAGSRWATRNVIPLAPPGNIRMLDAVEGRFAQGAGSPGLTAYLRRAGVRYVVVRNDLRRAQRRAGPGARPPGDRRLTRSVARCHVRAARGRRRAPRRGVRTGAGQRRLAGDRTPRCRSTGGRVRWPRRWAATTRPWWPVDPRTCLDLAGPRRDRRSAGRARRRHLEGRGRPASRRRGRADRRSAGPRALLRAHPRR